MNNPSEPQNPLADKAIALIEATRQQIKPAGKNTAPIWSKAHHQQQAARRITENLKRNQAAHLAASNAKAESAPPTPPL